MDPFEKHFSVNIAMIIHWHMMNDLSQEYMLAYSTHCGQDIELTNFPTQGVLKPTSSKTVPHFLVFVTFIAVNSKWLHEKEREKPLEFLGNSKVLEHHNSRQLQVVTPHFLHHSVH